MTYTYTNGAVNIGHNGKLVCTSKIVMDAEGYPVYTIPNIIGKNEGGAFGENIIDALSTVGLGYGDKIENVPFNAYPQYTVLRYVSRDVGEYIRRKTMRQFQGVKLGYSIRVNRVNDNKLSNYLSGYAGSNDALVYEGEGKRLFFETYSEAASRKASILGKYTNLLREYHKLRLSKSAGDLENWLGRKLDADTVMAYILQSELNGLGWELNIVQVMEIADESDSWDAGY